MKAKVDKFNTLNFKMGLYNEDDSWFTSELINQAQIERFILSIDEVTHVQMVGEKAYNQSYLLYLDYDVTIRLDSDNKDLNLVVETVTGKIIEKVTEALGNLECELGDLLGVHELSGVEYGDYNGASTITFILDDKLITAIEDENDGYRSCLGKLLVNNAIGRCENRFEPVKVYGFYNGSDNKEDVVSFIDMETKKEVLTIGTNNDDFYYPSFVANWQPENLSLNEVKK